MLQTKFQEYRSHTFRQDFLNVLPYMGVAVIKIICIIPNKAQHKIQL